jgi:dienelactone hydrolase
VHVKFKEEIIDYRDGDAELSGLLVWDGNEIARPGVLVVHGGAGLDDHAGARAPNSDCSCSLATCTART